jgi:hypothetical protein
MYNEDEQRRFRETISGKKEKRKKKESADERRARFIASLTPQERADRERKIKEQGGAYEDGGIPCNKKKNKMAALAKLAKTGSSK